MGELWAKKKNRKSGSAIYLKKNDKIQKNKTPGGADFAFRTMGCPPGTSEFFLRFFFIFKTQTKPKGQELNTVIRFPVFARRPRAAFPGGLRGKPPVGRSSLDGSAGKAVAGGIDEAEMAVGGLADADARCGGDLRGSRAAR